MELTSLGWRPFFADQLRSDESAALRPLRVVAIHRTGHVLADGAREWRVQLGRFWFRRPPEERPTVGDWVLADAKRAKIVRCLARANVLRRMAAGPKTGLHLLAANVDALFIVTSCNAEFSAGRLQRFLALAAHAGVEPLIVLTKADLAAEPKGFGNRARAVAGGVPVELVNALEAATLAGVGGWLRPGRTVALLGSSGVGKSTLVNTLSGRQLQATRPIREQDGKGRHTTTSRSLLRLPGGALLLDGPGLRELGTAIAADDVGQVFADIEALAANCRFGDCRHQSEPDCAVRAAVAAGRLATQRLHGYRAFVAEQHRLVERSRKARRGPGPRTRDHDEEA